MLAKQWEAAEPQTGRKDKGRGVALCRGHPHFADQLPKAWALDVLQGNILLRGQSSALHCAPLGHFSVMPPNFH
jgi:hypothetical protein